MLQSSKRLYQKKKNIDLILAPLYLYQVNTAEKAMNIFKDHFIIGLAMVNSSFPLHLWCRLLLLAITTPNLLQPL